MADVMVMVSGYIFCNSGDVEGGNKKNEFILIMVTDFILKKAREYISIMKVIQHTPHSLTMMGIEI